MTKTNKQNDAAGRLTEADLLARGYKHIVRGTLRMDHNSNKQIVKIRTFGPDGKYDGKSRWVFTSDLHQCAWTETGKDEIAPAVRKRIISNLREAAEV